MDDASYVTHAYNKDGSLSKKYTVSYKCAHCQKLFSKSDVQVDHIQAIGPFPELTEWVGLGLWLSKLFCSQDNLQVLCKDACHLAKSYIDRVKMKVPKVK